jgi:hypothetical protein
MNQPISRRTMLRGSGVALGNLWQTMFDVMEVPVPADFQGGEADGATGELIG